jgi:D-glycero-alpha-D-manno-heptose-7-phosphate kinase
MIFKTRAPLRISFGGGGTDVSPYPETKGGCAINSTINHYITTAFEQDDSHELRVHSLDYDTVVKFGSSSDLAYDGNMDLIKAVFSYMDILPSGDLYISSDAPPGSGLGSSSTLTVNLVSLLSTLKGSYTDEYRIARDAYIVERERMGIPGGRQDQYAASFGGFNFMEFKGKDTVVNPLRIKRQVIAELETSLLLCFTGQTRGSAKVIEDQTRNLKKGGRTEEAMDRTVDLAKRIKDALITGRTEEFGRLLDEGWTLKKEFSEKISNPRIDRFYDDAMALGCLGGKLLGAGGGGYLLMYTPLGLRREVSRVLEASGGKIVPFTFDLRGVQTWRVIDR